jgi:hypothetical protein
MGKSNAGPGMLSKMKKEYSWGQPTGSEVPNSSMSLPVWGVGVVCDRARLVLDVHARVQQNVDFLLQCKADHLNVLTLFRCDASV